MKSVYHHREESLKPTMNGKTLGSHPQPTATSEV